MISKMYILKIIPPKILAGNSLLLITYNITTSITRKDILILSYVMYNGAPSSVPFVLCRDQPALIAHAEQYRSVGGRWFCALKVFWQHDVKDIAS
jgi:hypothetical protein